MLSGKEFRLSDGTITVLPREVFQAPSVRVIQHQKTFFALAISSSSSFAKQIASFCFPPHFCSNSFVQRLEFFYWMFRTNHNFWLVVDVSANIENTFLRPAGFEPLPDQMETRRWRNYPNQRPRLQKIKRTASVGQEKEASGLSGTWVKGRRGIRHEIFTKDIRSACRRKTGRRRRGRVVKVLCSLRVVSPGR